MGRYIVQKCPNCGRSHLQDWEEPDECPYCDGRDRGDDGDGDEPDTNNDALIANLMQSRSRRKIEAGWQLCEI